MNSDKVWENISEENPYFGVLSDEKYRGRDITEEMKQEFYKTGEDAIANTINRLSQLYGDFNSPDLNVIDFGCGVGRLTLPLARRCGHVWGVDIAEQMRRLTQRAAEQAGLKNVQLAATPADISSESGTNWLNTSVVFQHIPIERGYKIFDELLSKLVGKCYISAMFTLFKSPIILDYLDKPLFLKQQEIGQYVIGGVTMAFDKFTADHMAMYDYDADQIIALLIKHGFASFTCDTHLMGTSYAAVFYAKRD